MRAQLGDARRLRLEDSSVDAVITSPPYPNVINYHQQHRPVMEALGYDILKHARSEVGSNRKNRQNRFLTVKQYAHDMALVLAELCRVCKSDGTICLVVGIESIVCGQKIPCAQLVKDIMVAAGGEVEEASRSFQNRYGVHIQESILTMRNLTSAKDVDHECIANKVFFGIDHELARKAVNMLIEASPLLHT